MMDRTLDVHSFTLGRLLGEGAHAKVFLAEHEEKRFALKAIKTSTKQDEDEALAEQLMLEQFPHPSM